MEVDAEGAELAGVQRRSHTTLRRRHVLGRTAEAATGWRGGFETLGMVVGALLVWPPGPPPPQLVALGINCVEFPLDVLRPWIQERELSTAMADEQTTSDLDTRRREEDSARLGGQEASSFLG